MAQSGWYDDPDGTVGRLRYWDGTQWTQSTMLKPGAAPDPTAVMPPYQPAPSAAQPTPSQPLETPLGTGQAPYRPTTLPPTPMPSSATARRGVSPLLVIGVVVLAIGVMALLPRLLGGSSPAVPATTTTASQPASPGTTNAAPSLTPGVPGTGFPTATETTQVTVPGTTIVPTLPDPGPGTEAPVIDCPLPTGTTLTDGTLQVGVPQGWTTTQDMFEPWQCQAMAVHEVTQGWLASAIVGLTTDGGTPEAFAKRIWEWNLAGGYEGDNSPIQVTSARITSGEAVTVGKLKGYKLSGQVKITGLDGIPGDEVRILVLQRADGGLSSLTTVHTLGDADSTSAIERLWESVKVVG